MKHQTMLKKRNALAFLLAGLGISGAAQATLINNGGGLIYDNVANVSWASDANTFSTMASTISNSLSSLPLSNQMLANKVIAAVPTVTDSLGTIHAVGKTDVPGSGLFTWVGAMAWVKYLSDIDYKGHNNWMLPTTYDQTCSGYNCTNSMLGELFYTGIGGTAGQSITTSHNASFSLFTNITDTVYWSGTESTARGPGFAWVFVSNTGLQGIGNENSIFNAWAVLPGNAVAAGGPTTVPEPPSLALMLLGLPLIGVSVRRRGWFDFLAIPSPRSEPRAGHYRRWLFSLKAENAVFHRRLPIINIAEN